MPLFSIFLDTFLKFILAEPFSNSIVNGRETLLPTSSYIPFKIELHGLR